MEAEEITKQAKTLLLDKKAADVVIMDVRQLSTITDYYVIATGNNSRHLKALIQEVSTVLKKAHGVRSHRMSGDPESGWVILDYLDVVIHVFLPETREHYALETLWKDAVMVDQGA